MNQIENVYTDLLSTKEVAARLRVSEYTIVRWTLDGRLPCVKFGKLNKYVWSEIQKRIQSGELLTKKQN